MKQEIYAALEIRAKQLIFIVTHYQNDNFDILYRKQVEGDFSHDGEVNDPKITGALVHGIINEVYAEIGIKIQSIGVILPNHNIKILKHIKTASFKEPKKLTKEDIIELKNSTEEISILNDEIISFIKPYTYLINKDSKTRQFKPPVGKKVKALTIKSLIYVTKKKIFYSHMNVLKFAKLNHLVVIPRSYALGWSTGLNNLKDALVIVDWNEETLDFNIFVKESLCEYKSFKKLALENLINHLKKMFKFSSYQEIKNYLFNVLNYNVENGKKLIIYSKILMADNSKLTITMKELQDEVKLYCDQCIKTINWYLKKVFDASKHLSPPNIVYTGDILSISGVRDLLAKNTVFDIQFYVPNIIGMQYSWGLSLIGNIYYQHINNLINQTSYNSLIF